MQATQIPNAPSKKEKRVRMAAITSDAVLKEKSAEKIINEVKSSPMRAAKIFGPALIHWVSNGRYLRMAREVIPNKL